MTRIARRATRFVVTSCRGAGLSPPVLATWAVNREGTSQLPYWDPNVPAKGQLEALRDFWQSTVLSEVLAIFASSE